MLVEASDAMTMKSDFICKPSSSLKNLWSDLCSRWHDKGSICCDRRHGNWLAGCLPVLRVFLVCKTVEVGTGLSDLIYGPSGRDRHPFFPFRRWRIRTLGGQSGLLSRLSMCTLLRYISGDE